MLDFCGFDCFCCSKNDTLDECLRITDKNGPVVTAIASDDDVAFYRFSSVDLPVL